MPQQQGAAQHVGERDQVQEQRHAGKEPGLVGREQDPAKGEENVHIDENRPVPVPIVVVVVVVWGRPRPIPATEDNYAVATTIDVQTAGLYVSDPQDTRPTERPEQ